LILFRQRVSLNKNIPTEPQHLQKKAMKVSKAW
jgi:hypothetical protein